MVALAAIVSIFVAAGAAVIIVGLTRSRKTAESAKAGSTGKLFALGIALCVVGIGLAVPLWLVIRDHQDVSKTAAGGVKLTASQEEGRQLFARNCSTCHTLAASRAVGKTGPNLDVMRPPAPLIYNAIVMGRARGNGNMPAGLVSGQQAKDVSSYVAAVAGYSDVAAENAGSGAAAGAGSMAGGSMGAGSSGAGAATPKPAKAGTVNVTLTEMKVTPVPTSAPAGVVTFNVKNAGSIPHEMVVIKTDKPAGKLGSGTTVPETGKVGEVADLGAGKSKTLKLKLTAGHYALICNIPGHYAAGMWADFDVK